MKNNNRNMADIYECVKFGADPIKNLDLMNGFIRGLLGLGGGINSPKCHSSCYIFRQLNLKHTTEFKGHMQSR